MFTLNTWGVQTHWFMFRRTRFAEFRFNLFCVFDFVNNIWDCADRDDLIAHVTADTSSPLENCAEPNEDGYGFDGSDCEYSLEEVPPISIGYFFFLSSSWFDLLYTAYLTLHTLRINSFQFFIRFWCKSQLNDHTKCSDKIDENWLESMIFQF